MFDIEENLSKLKILEPIAKVARRYVQENGKIGFRELREIIRTNLRKIKDDKARRLIELIYLIGPGDKERKALRPGTSERLITLLTVAVTYKDPNAYCSVCKNFFGEKFSLGRYQFRPTACSKPCSFKLPERMEKIKNTLFVRYGVTNASQSNEVKNKKVKTLLANYGVTNPSYSLEIQEKKINTFLERYGETNPLKNEEVKNKSRATCMERYGVTSTGGYAPRIEKSKATRAMTSKSKSKRNNIRKRTVATCLSRYGVASPMQNLEIYKKASKNSYNRKTVTLGNVVYSNLMGFEPEALAFLINTGKVNPKNIVNNIKLVGSFDYRFKGKDRKYFPDFKIKNTYVEVKSTYTSGIIGKRGSETVACLKAKMKAVEKEGHRIYCMIRGKKTVEGNHSWIVIQSSSFKTNEVRSALKKNIESFHVVGGLSPLHKPA